MHTQLLALQLNYAQGLPTPQAQKPVGFDCFTAEASRAASAMLVATLHCRSMANQQNIVSLVDFLANKMHFMLGSELL